MNSLIKHVVGRSPLFEVHPLIRVTPAEGVAGAYYGDTSIPVPGNGRWHLYRLLTPSSGYTPEWKSLDALRLENRIQLIELDSLKRVDGRSIFVFRRDAASVYVAIPCDKVGIGKLVYQIRKIESDAGSQAPIVSTGVASLKNLATIQAFPPSKSLYWINGVFVNAISGKHVATDASVIFYRDNSITDKRSVPMGGSSTYIYPNDESRTVIQVNDGGGSVLLSELELYLMNGGIGVPLLISERGKVEMLTPNHISINSDLLRETIDALRLNPEFNPDNSLQMLFVIRDIPSREAIEGNAFLGQYRKLTSRELLEEVPDVGKFSDNLYNGEIQELTPERLKECGPFLLSKLSNCGVTQGKLTVGSSLHDVPTKGYYALAYSDEGEITHANNYPSGGIQVVSSRYECITGELEAERNRYNPLGVFNRKVDITYPFRLLIKANAGYHDVTDNPAFVTFVDGKPIAAKGMTEVLYVLNTGISFYANHVIPDESIQTSAIRVNCTYPIVYNNPIVLMNKHTLTEGYHWCKHGSDILILTDRFLIEGAKNMISMIYRPQLTERSQLALTTVDGNPALLERYNGAVVTSRGIRQQFTKLTALSPGDIVSIEVPINEYSSITGELKGVNPYPEFAANHDALKPIVSTAKFVNGENIISPTLNSIYNTLKELPMYEYEGLYELKDFYKQCPQAEKLAVSDPIFKWSPEILDATTVKAHFEELIEVPVELFNCLERWNVLVGSPIELKDSFIPVEP